MMTTADALPDLLAILATEEFEEHGNMRIAAAHWSADRLDVRMQVDDGRGEHSGWNLRFRGVLEYTLAKADNCGLNVRRSDHPAIDQHTDVRAFLHFGAAPADPFRVVGRLLSAHLELVDDWIPFDRY